MQQESCAPRRVPPQGPSLVIFSGWLVLIVDYFVVAIVQWMLANKQDYNILTFIYIHNLFVAVGDDTVMLLVILLVSSIGGQ
jgi:uncharacterized membrane protein